MWKNFRKAARYSALTFISAHEGRAAGDQKSIRAFVYLEYKLPAVNQLVNHKIPKILHSSLFQSALRSR